MTLSKHKGCEMYASMDFLQNLDFISVNQITMFMF
jgi:hypothetical protein